MNLRPFATGPFGQDFNLGGILRRSDPLGRIYGWIPSGGLLDTVTTVPYLAELYMERNTEKLKPARIVLKRIQTPQKQKVYIQQEKVSRFYYFFLILNCSVQSLHSHTNSYNNAIKQCHVDGAHRAWGTCVYTTQMNSTFRTRQLVSSDVIIQVPFTSSTIDLK